MKPTNLFRWILFVFALAGAATMTVWLSTAQDKQANCCRTFIQRGTTCGQARRRLRRHRRLRDLPCRTAKEFCSYDHGKRHGASQDSVREAGLRRLSWTWQGPRGGRRRQRYYSCPLHQGFQHARRRTKCGLPLLPFQGKPDLLERQPARVSGHGLRRLPSSSLRQPRRTICRASFCRLPLWSAAHRACRHQEATTRIVSECHQMRRAQLQRSSHMPYREGKVTCTSCHNPHGSPNPSQLLQSTINENCYSCHAERRGHFCGSILRSWKTAPTATSHTAAATHSCSRCGCHGFATLATWPAATPPNRSRLVPSRTSTGAAPIATL